MDAEGPVMFRSALQALALGGRYAADSRDPAGMWVMERVSSGREKARAASGAGDLVASSASAMAGTSAPTAATRAAGAEGDRNGDRRHLVSWRMSRASSRPRPDSWSRSRAREPAARAGRAAPEVGPLSRQ